MEPWATALVRIIIITNLFQEYFFRILILGILKIYICSCCVFIHKCSAETNYVLEENDRFCDLNVRAFIVKSFGPELASLPFLTYL